MLLLGGGARVYEPIIGKVIAAVERAVQLSVISEDRLDDAVRHILWLKARLGLLPPC
jgi:beta-glucosidase-like glycosyl hydrolase